MGKNAVTGSIREQVCGGDDKRSHTQNYQCQKDRMQKDGENAYKCDVELQVSHNGEVQSGVTPLRFVKDSDGWLLSK